MQPNNITPEPSPQIPEAVPAATRLVISPINEAAVLQVLSEAKPAVLPNPEVAPDSIEQLARVEPEQTPAPTQTPVETPPHHDYAPAAQVANVAAPSAVRSEAEVASTKVPIQWPKILAVGALVPVSILIFNAILAILIVTFLLPVLFATFEFGAISAVLWTFVSLIPLAITYKIFVPYLRNTLLLQHPVLIFLGIYSLTLVLQPLLAIITRGESYTEIYILFMWLQYLGPIVAGVIGAVIATLITNVFNLENPRMRVGIMWAIILLPIVILVGTYASTYWELFM